MTDQQLALMAPGHVYMPALGSGIQWTEKEVLLWQNGKPFLRNSHQTASAYEYFYGLHFAGSFPMVTHWWFRSAWTQRVRLSGPQGQLDGGTVWGYMQFVDGQVPAHMWAATALDGGSNEIALPYPPNEIQPVNLPLRMALARLVAGVLADEVQRDTWLAVTSLVAVADLELTFPTDPASTAWRIEGIYGSVRRELCALQGLKELQGV